MRNEYVQYYRSQAGGAIPVFSGTAIQRGKGFGSVFKSLFRFASPLVRALLPVARKAAPVIGREMLQASSNVLQDVASGANIKEAAKVRFKTAGENLTQAALKRLQEGQGMKRKRKAKKDAKRRRTSRSKVDIFSG